MSKKDQPRPQPARPPVRTGGPPKLESAQPPISAGSQPKLPAAQAPISTPAAQATEGERQPLRTLDQRRARHAWDAVRKYIHEENGNRVVRDDAKKFGGQAHKLPARILASGLGQALAFLRAKKAAPDLLIELGDWILDKRGHPESKDKKPLEDALLLRIVDDSADFLRRATDEALAYLQWLNRFAEAEGLSGGKRLMALILPKTTTALIARVKLGERHPGLQLDKYSSSGEQTEQHNALRDVCQVPGDAQLLEDLWRRRESMLASLPGLRSFRCVTAGPLTLHLARASALENAGIALHPVYGFSYLPASGLKGLARAYAESVWLSGEPDPVTAWGLIEAVFGWAPGSDVIGKDERGRAQIKPWKPAGITPHGEDDGAASGQVIFHDAWPTSWPKLLVDIVNNHHPAYYRGADDPGDWDSPNPVYFLAVPAGTPFAFSLGKRRADVPDTLLDRAREWLEGGLTHLGAGAKTAAGYGYFRPAASAKSTAPVPPSPALTSFTTTLELATPAFLAGAGRQKDDCDLRSATVRGILRWWWRAMHAGFVDVATLRRLEAAVWGDTTCGGAVRVEVLPLGKVDSLAYDKHAAAKKNDLPPTGDKKTTPGLWYHSYGMHDGGKQRQYLPPGTKWQLVLWARDGLFFLTDNNGQPVTRSARRIDKAILLDQARAALWWLCMVGGVGSKSRKGFGNFRGPPELAGFEGGRFVSKGKELRVACGLPDDGFKAEKAGGPSLRLMVDLGRQIPQGGSGWVELTIPTTNVWQAIDAAGMAAQMFAKKYKRRGEKAALGLPRNIGKPARFPDGLRPNDRHASPIHYHLHREGNEYILRVAAFPAARLPSLTESGAMLGELLRHFVDTFP